MVTSSKNLLPIMGQMCTIPSHTSSVLLSVPMPGFQPPKDLNTHDMCREQHQVSISHPLTSSRQLPELNRSSPHPQHQMTSQLKFPINDLVKPSPVHKWNMVCDSSKEGLIVERFLFRIEANTSAYNIPDFKSLTEIQYFLRGKASN